MDTSFFSKNISGLLQGAGRGLLTILIPFAIAILTYTLQSKKEEKPFSELDLHVIIKRMFNLEWLITSTLLILFIPIFWDNINESFSFLIFAAWCFGAFLLLRILTRIFNWISSEESIFKERFEYLRQLIDITQLEMVWAAVWKTKIDRFQDEREFFSIFAEKIENQINDTTLSLRLLHIFKDYIEIRSDYLLISEALPFFLKWHSINWHKIDR